MDRTFGDQLLKEIDPIDQINHRGAQPLAAPPIIDYPATVGVPGAEREQPGFGVLPFQ